MLSRSFIFILSKHKHQTENYKCKEHRKDGNIIRVSSGQESRVFIMVIGSQGDFSRDVQVRIAKSLVVNNEFEDTKFIRGLFKEKK